MVPAVHGRCHLSLGCCIQDMPPHVGTPQDLGGHYTAFLKVQLTAAAQRFNPFPFVCLCTTFCLPAGAKRYPMGNPGV